MKPTKKEKTFAHRVDDKWNDIVGRLAVYHQERGFFYYHCAEVNQHEDVVGKDQVFVVVELVKPNWERISFVFYA